MGKAGKPAVLMCANLIPTSILQCVTSHVYLDAAPVSRAEEEAVVLC